MTDDFELEAPNTITGENQDTNRGAKTIWPVFPKWGKRGYLIEYRPPSSHNNYPYVIIQAITQYERTFKKARKQFNPKQLETGMYTPTVSLSFSAIPIIINALNEMWETWRNQCVEPPGNNPQADAGLEDYRKMVRNLREDTAVDAMSEFGGGQETKPAPQPAPDIWDTLRAEADAARNEAAQAAPISDADESGGNEGDDLDGLGEFGGGRGNGKRLPF